MFCSNCGKEIAEGTKFCGVCGAQQGGASQQRTAAAGQTTSTGTTSNRNKKKSTTILASVCVMLVAFVVGKNIIAPSMLTKMDNSQMNTQPGNTSVSTEVGTTTGTGAELHSAYQDIFLSRNIVHMDTYFIGMESMAFAMVDSDGAIHCLDFGYENDTIYSMVERMYIDISGLSESDKAAFDAQMHSEFGGYETLSYATIDYHLGNSYYTLSVRMDGLEQMEILHSAIDQNLITADKSGALLSMSLTQSDLLNQGYIQK